MFENLDWAHLISNAIAGAVLFYCGRYSQRRDDRRAAIRDLNEAAQRFDAWKNRNRGA